MATQATPSKVRAGAGPMLAFALLLDAAAVAGRCS